MKRLSAKLQTSTASGDRDEDGDDQSQSKPKRYLRKKQVARRYGNVNERTVPRMVADGRLPPPDLYNGRFPLWDEARLDAHDRAQVLAHGKPPHEEEARAG